MKIGFLGYGNLARALDAGIKKEQILPAGDIYVCENNEAALTAARAAGHPIAADIKELFALCDIVVILIKPAVFRSMKPLLSGLDTRGRRVISGMAAVHTGELSQVFGCPVLRVMPTLAAAHSKGPLGYSGGAGFEDIIPALSRMGDAVCLDDDMLDRLTVAASCGLGFAAHIMDAYRAECIKHGFSPEDSNLIARSIFSYPADLATGSLSELVDRVATKGGATEAGILAMDQHLRSALAAAFAAAGERARPN